MPGIWQHFEAAGTAQGYRPVRFVAWATGAESDTTRYAVALMDENHFGWVRVQASAEHQGRFWDILERSSGGWYGTEEEATQDVRAAVQRMLQERDRRSAATDAYVKRVGARLDSRGLKSEDLALFAVCCCAREEDAYNVLGGTDDAMAEHTLDAIEGWKQPRAA